ncbi:MAG: glycosyltransferase [Halorhabdus sp.]
MDLAVAHKDYDVLGGGELVAEELARTFDAPLYVGRVGESLSDRDADPTEITTGRASAWLRSRGGLPRSIGHMLGWMQADELTDYEVVVTSGNEPRWYTPTDEQVVVAYTHSPPRWMYDLHHRFDASLGGRLGQFTTVAQRALFHHTTDFPDLFVANSDLVARRIRRYYNVPADRVRTVYPPVEVTAYDPSLRDTGDYYVTVGRLDGAKHVDAIVEAFNGLDATLKVAGDGEERDALEAAAGESVEMLGYVSEAKKRRLLSGAKAFVFAGANEDFCMSTVEALASGTPVITVDEGFPPMQIGAHLDDGRRGLTFARGESTSETAGNLRRAVREFEVQGVTWAPQDIATFADRFSVAEFRRGMREAVEVASERCHAEPSWDEASLTPGDGGSEETALSDGGEEK